MQLHYYPSILSLFILVLSICPHRCESVTIYVSNPRSGVIPTNSCINTTVDSPCNDLHASLKLLEHLNNSNVMIFPGTYNLPQYSSYTFSKLRNIGIMRVLDQKHSKSSEPVIIKCTRNRNSSNLSYTGLGFLNVESVEIKEVSFYSCGTMRNSTSRDFNEPNLTLIPVMTALYFTDCKDVTLQSIWVRQSVGVAVQMFSTAGSVLIIDSNFTDSVPDNLRFWGGGVYIEFPYCQPGNSSCDTQRVDASSVSNASYTIHNCTFRNNTARDTFEDVIVLAYQSYHKTMGRGGGMSIIFKGESTNNVFNVTDCVFDGNRADHGAGLYLEMQDSASDNSVYLMGSKFTENYSKFHGGGLLASYICLSQNKNSMNLIQLNNTTFKNNQVGNGKKGDVEGGKGGGVSFVTFRQPTESIKTKFSISNSVFDNNTAFMGSAIRISAYSAISYGYLDPVEIHNVQITNNVVQFYSSRAPLKSGALGSGGLYVSHVPLCLSGLITIDNNHGGTALAAYHSVIHVADGAHVSFANNSGYNGGALALRSSSVLKLGKSVSLYFFGNKAFNKGGAIYADFLDPSINIEVQGCFIQYHDIIAKPTQWNVSVTFRNNKDQVDKPNSIHASTLHPCMLGRPYGVVRNEHQLLWNVFCWNTNESILWDYGDDDPQDCNKHITSDLWSFHNNSHSLSVIPGKTVSMNLTGIDDQGDSVNTSIIVHAHSLDESIGVSLDSAYSYTSNGKIKLKNSNNVSSAVIQLNTVGQQLEVQTVLNITFKECPPGLSLDESSGFCTCNGTYSGKLKCDSAQLKASLLTGYWIGEHSECKGDERQPVIAHCKYCDFSGFESYSGYYELGEDWGELERKLCGKNRHGHMCSVCDDGYKPAINANEFKCVKCGSIVYGVVLFLVCNIICPLAFIFAIFILDVPLTNGLLHGPIFFAQMVTTVVTIDAEDVIQYQKIAPNFHEVFEHIYTTVYGLFNLDFFVNFANFCIGLDQYSHIVSLQFIVGLVPMTLVLLCWAIIMCFNHRSDRTLTINIKGFFHRRFENIANVMATCMLLSYTKLTVIACYLLTPISLISADGHLGDYSHGVMYIDGSVCYPSSKMYLYFALSIVVAVIFLIPTPLTAMVFRYNTKQESRTGFFDKLLKQFQQQFRNSNDRNDEIESSRRCSIHKKSKTCCDPCTCCGRTVLHNRTEFTCECCTPTNICKYQQWKPRYGCPFITTFSLHDLRWLSGFMFVLRIMMVLPYVLAWTVVIRYCIQLCICMFVGITILVIKPYKREQYKYVDCNRVEAYFFFSLAFLLSLCIYQYNYSTTSGLTLSIWVYVIQVSLMTVPFVWIASVYTVLLIHQYRDSRVRVKLRQLCSTMCCGMPDRVEGRGQYHHVGINDDEPDHREDIDDIDVEPSWNFQSINSVRRSGSITTRSGVLREGVI